MQLPRLPWGSETQLSDWGDRACLEARFLLRTSLLLLHEFPRENHGRVRNQGVQTDFLVQGKVPGRYITAVRGTDAQQFLVLLGREDKNVPDRPGDCPDHKVLRDQGLLRQRSQTHHQGHLPAQLQFYFQLGTEVALLVQVYPELLWRPVPHLVGPQELWEQRGQAGDVADESEQQVASLRLRAFFKKYFIGISKGLWGTITSSTSCTSSRGFSRRNKERRSTSAWRSTAPQRSWTRRIRSTSGERSKGQLHLR